MKDIEELLNQVYPIIVKNNTEKEAQRQRGELFNVFQVLRLTSDEVRTHSAFLAELLNPNGSHGMKHRFLELFLETLFNNENFEFDATKAKVTVEYYIGEINEKGTEGGRLDLLIESAGKAIIIENKIYAGDQKNQLIRYHNFAENKFNGNYKLLYLTLDGHEASEESIEKEKGFQYIPVSYKNEIFKWLDKCCLESARKPKVRETIDQYIHLIKQLTNQDLDMANEIAKEVLGSEKKVRAAVAIERTMKEVKAECLNKVFDNIFIELTKEKRIPEERVKWARSFEVKESKQDFYDYYDSNRDDIKRRGLEIEIGEWNNHKVIFRIAVTDNLYFGFILRKENNIIPNASDLVIDNVRWEKCKNDWICWKYPDIQENINWRYNFWEFNDNVIDLVYDTGGCFGRFIDECLSLISKMQEKLEKQGQILYFAKIYLPNSQIA